jgi:hypothetical protein
LFAKSEELYIKQKDILFSSLRSCLVSPGRQNQSALVIACEFVPNESSVVEDGS